MAYQEQHSEGLSAVELIAQRGLDGLPAAVAELINEAMRVERDHHLGAGHYERSDERRGYANGYKTRTMKTRMGALELKVPQVREGGFYPQSLDTGLRSERALKLALAQMYVEGVSTRKVAKITEQRCGFDVSSAEVSRCAALLDEELSAWRGRDLGAYPYLFLDARYEKVRQGGHVVDAAVLVALGVSPEGKREVLGISVELSEAEIHWRHFLEHRVTRGLNGVKLFISDRHAGLKAARAAVFPSVPWQRCQCHLQRNAGQYVPHKSQRKAVAEGLRDVFNAPTVEDAKRLLDRFLKAWETKAPKLVEWASEAVPECLAVFSLPAEHRHRLRTSNALERLNKALLRRTRVAPLFPSDASCERLVSAVAMEISQDWVSGRTYLNMDVGD